MLWLIMVLALGAAVMTELFLPVWETAGQVHWPVVICVVVYYALNHSSGVALAAGAAAGVITDAVNGLPPGSSPLVFCALSLLIGRGRDFVFIRRWLTHMFLGAFAGAALTLFMYLLLAWRYESIRSLAPAWVFLKAIGTGILGLLAMPPVFLAMETLETRLGCRGSLITDDF